MNKLAFPYLKAPLYTDPEKNGRAALVYRLAVMVLFAGVLVLATAFLTHATNLLLTISLVLAGSAVLTLVLAHYNQLELGGGLLVLLFWLAALFLGFRTGGMSGPSAILFLLSVVLAASLAGRQAALLTGILAAVGLTGLWLVGRSGAAGQDELNEVLAWALYNTAFLISAGLLAAAIYQSRNIYSRLREDVQRLSAQIQDLQIQRDTYAQRFAERNTEISRHLMYMQIHNELTVAMNTFADADRLAQEAVTLLRDRLGLYYVGMFLVDAGKQWAVLKAGTGEAGQSFLARNHRIELGTGMIGWTILHARPRVAADVSADMVRLASSELPHTRSEAAIPMRTHSGVVGAFSVQSTQPSAFNQETVSVLQGIADWLGAVLENRRLNEEMDKVQTEQSAQTGKLDAGVWLDTFGGAEKGYLYDRTTITALRPGYSADVSRAWESGRMQPGNENGAPVLYLPVSVRDQVVSVLALRKLQGEPDWSVRELDLLEKLASHLGEALDNARLYESLQRQAQREQFVAELSNQMRASLDIETILSNTAEELFQKLKLEVVDVQLEQPEAASLEETV